MPGAPASTMKLQRITLFAIFLGLAGAPGIAQTPGNPPAEKKLQPQAPAQATAPQATAKDPFVDPKSVGLEKDSARADAYFNYTMGHIYEQQYEATSNADYATKAIEAYKKAYTLDPKSPVIGERLAEIYWKAQRTKEAETEAEDVLRRDPNDVQSRGLLRRIYLLSVGTVNAGSGRYETANEARELVRLIHRLDSNE